MTLLKFYVYVFFSLKRYYFDFCHAFSVFLTVIIINAMTIVFFYMAIKDLQISDIIFFPDIDEYFARRFYIFVVDLIPLILIGLMIYLLNKKKIKKYWEEFKQYPKEIIRKKNKQVTIYYIFTGALFVLSIFSSSFL